MSKVLIHEAIVCTKPDTKVNGQIVKTKTATVATLDEPNLSLGKADSKLDPCDCSKDMRSRIEEFKFQVARGWLNSVIAAAYLGISVKTLYNLKNKGLIKSEGEIKLIFKLNELDRFLKGQKNETN